MSGHRSISLLPRALQQIALELLIVCVALTAAYAQGGAKDGSNPVQPLPAQVGAGSINAPAPNTVSGLSAPTASSAPASVMPAALEVNSAHARAWKLLGEAFRSKKTSTRVESLSALSMIAQNPRAVSMVESALADPAPEVRGHAATVLAQMDATSSVAKIKPLLKDKSPEVSFAAARALSQLGDASGRDVLIEVLTGDRRVTGGLVDSGKDFARQFTFKDGIFLGATEGATVFAGPFGAIGVSALRQIFFQERTATSRASSAEALAPDGTERVIKILEEALKDKDWTVRFSAANALGVAPTKEPIPHLAKMLDDKKFAVRLMSAASIIRLAGDQQLPVLGSSNGATVPQTEN